MKINLKKFASCFIHFLGNWWKNNDDAERPVIIKHWKLNYCLVENTRSMSCCDVELTPSRCERDVMRKSFQFHSSDHFERWLNVDKWVEWWERIICVMSCFIQLHFTRFQHTFKVRFYDIWENTHLLNVHCSPILIIEFKYCSSFISQ